MELHKNSRLEEGSMPEQSTDQVSIQSEVPEALIVVDKKIAGIDLSSSPIDGCVFPAHIFSQHTAPFQEEAVPGSEPPKEQTLIEYDPTTYYQDAAPGHISQTNYSSYIVQSDVTAVPDLSDDIEAWTTAHLPLHSVGFQGVSVDSIVVQAPESIDAAATPMVLKTYRRLCPPLPDSSNGHGSENWRERPASSSLSTALGSRTQAGSSFNAPCMPDDEQDQPLLPGYSITSATGPVAPFPPRPRPKDQGSRRKHAASELREQLWAQRVGMEQGRKVMVGIMQGNRKGWAGDGSNGELADLSREDMTG